MKRNFIDLTGKRFGRLTVVGIYDRTPNGCIRWRCRCDCGNEIPVFKSVLMRNNGSIKSCGCVYLDELKKHIGEKKDYLEIIGVEQIGRKGRIIVRCCCGKEKKMKLSQFYNKNVHSCGCIGVKKGKDSPNYIHGMSKTRIFNIYRDMINRCYNKNDISYKNYGGRGITVCPEWLGEKGVTNFTEWSYTNGYDEKAPRGKCTIDRIDVNGNYDGQIDSDDRVAIGHPTIPEIIYGFGPSITWKKWDFSVFFQGQANVSLMMSGFEPFGTQSKNNVLEWIAEDYWSKENQNPNAKYPRLTKYNNNNNMQSSTYWLRNAAFLKLKNAEVGYNFKWGRVYMSGTNLLTFSPFKLWDPEMGGGKGMAYPTQRTFNLGVQITFK